MSEQNKTSDEQLRDYLTQDLALVKLQLNESKRSVSKLLCLAFMLVFLVFACVGGFAATVFLITQEHTKQLQSIFDACWESESGGTKEEIYQDSGPSAPAIINNRISSSTITTHNNITN